MTITKIKLTTVPVFYFQTQVHQLEVTTQKHRHKGTLRQAHVKYGPTLSCTKPYKKLKYLVDTTKLGIATFR